MSNQQLQDSRYNPPLSPLSEGGSKRGSSCIMHRASCIVFLILALLLPMVSFAAPQMADYCYLPPFVTDPNTTPNVMFVYEKGSAITKRAYTTTYTYDAQNPYYGFFDSRDSNNNLIYYKFTTVSVANKAFSPNYFEKPTTTCSPASDPKCIPGDILNWALMTTLDLSRKVLIGFGWPKSDAGQGAGDVYTYSGNFNGSDTTPISYGQYEDGNADTSVSAWVDTDGNGLKDYTYRFCMSKGNFETIVSVNGQNDATGTNIPSCPNPNNAAKCNSSATCLGRGMVAMKFTSEDRKGLIQQYADKDSNYEYDSDAPRFGLRRWKQSPAAGNDRDRDILCDANGGNCTSTTKTTLLKEYLNAFSKEPGIDPDDAALGTMMKDIVNYFSGNPSTYADKDSAYTQTPYSWSTDPAKNCRKTFAIFVTTGGDLSGGDTLTMPAACTSLDATLTSAFAKNACYGFNTDIYTADGGTFSPLNKWQNIRTYVVHTDFYGKACTTAAQCAAGQTCSGGYCRSDVAKLTYAAKTVGGGEYISVDNPAKLRSKIEEAFLNILSTSASASTVATLTTQTRESSTLTQAYFYPKRENTPLRWLGYLRLLWSDSGANLREDTMNTGWLDLKKDNILSFYYDPTLVAYKGRTFAVKNESPYLMIDTCDPNDAKVTTKLNDNILTIWNAQDKLLAMSPTARTIKIGLGDTSTADGKAGKVSGSSCTGSAPYSGFCNFTTSLASTLQPFWNYTGSCNLYSSRWCAQGSDCNYCTALRGTYSVDRGCSSATDCQYCDERKTRKCSTTLTCIDTTLGTDLLGVACATVGASCGGTGVCVGDCYEYSGTCSVGTCTLDTSKTCTADADCIGDYHGSTGGSGCVTGDTCTTGDTCNAECDTANCATQVIKFALGYDRPKNASDAITSPGNAFRLRHETITTADNTTTLKLGDIVYSTPRISPNSAVNGYDVTYSDNSYKNFKGSDTVKNATPIVIVGANDGMVHAFKVSKIKDISPPSTTGGGVTDGYQPARFSDDPPTSDSAPPSDIGKELWAYIPYNAVPYLRWYCEESYCHIPMVDARFTVVDASVDYNKNGFGAGSGSATDARTCDADGTNCVWRRLLIGAMGIGGRQITVGSNTWSSSVFVLDITNPTSPKLLWEMPLPDGALTTGTPAVVRLGDSAKNGTWYLLFGSGPTSVTTNKVNYKTDRPNIYVFDLRTGSLSATLPVGTDVAENKGVAVGDMTAVDFDSDYQVDDIYFGTYGGTGATQTGKFYRLRIRDGDNAGPPVTPKYQTTVSDWDIETVVNAGRPIFAASEIAQDAAGAKWLYFGTGLYLSLEHVTPTAYCTSSTTVCTENSDCSSGTCDPVTGYLEYLYGVKEPDACWKSGGASCTYNDPVANFLDTSNIKFTEAKAVEAGCFCAGQLMSTISCDSNGNCPGSCGTNKVCSNNTSQSCSLDSQCPTGGTGGTCIDNKVILKVNNAKISGLGVPTSPYACTNKIDTDAITCIENNINASNGCSGLGCKGWRRGIKGQKMFSKPFVAGGLADYTSFQPTSTVCSLGGNAHLISLHYTTGTAYVQPTIFLAGGTSVSAGGLEIKASVNLGIGVPPLGESLVALPLAGDTYKVITQVSGGLPGTTINPSLPAKSGYVLWIVK